MGMTSPHTIKDLYSFPGFEALLTLKDVPDDPGARVITLRRRQKKVPVHVVGIRNAAFTTARYTAFGTSTAPAFAYGSSLNTGEFIATGAKP